MSIPNSGIDTNTYNLNYNQGGIFYLEPPSDSSGTIICNLLNLPSLTNPNQTYVVSTVIRGTSGANCYCANVYVTNQSTVTGGTYYIPKFSSTPNVSNITNTNFVTQQLVYFYQSDISAVMSNVTPFTS